MALFPVYMELAGRLCVIAGGGPVAERKAASLLEYGAAVQVVSPDFTAGLLEMESAGKIKAVRRRFTMEDMEGAFLVIAATPDRRLNEAIGLRAAERAVLADIADNPGMCTFTFPSTVKRGELVVGISTSGGFPAMSKYIGDRLEGLLPENLGNVLETLKGYRNRAKSCIKDGKRRRELMGRLMEETGRHMDRAGARIAGPEGDAGRSCHEAANAGPADSIGKIDEEGLLRSLENIFREYCDE